MFAAFLSVLPSAIMNIFGHKSKPKTTTTSAAETSVVGRRSSLVFGGLDVDRILERLIQYGKFRPSELFFSGKRIVEKSEFKKLMDQLGAVLKNEQMLLELKPPINIIADVHGQFLDLIRWFRLCKWPPDANYLFLGDYVDRGPQGAETLCLLAALKIKFPKNVWLLRGNHETANVNEAYGFFDEINVKYNDKQLWNKIQQTFTYLPVAALINEKIFCLHGGLSPDLGAINRVTINSKLIAPLTSPDHGLLCDLIWSDPESNIIGWAESSRGISFAFGKNIVKQFCRDNNIAMIIRGHQMSTLVHAQYNSPMKLYSPAAVQEELDRATGQHSPRPPSAGAPVDQSGTYRAVHQNGQQLGPQHSARFDEPREYPQYKGYVDPNIQSPSFKRLQQYTGLDQSSEEASHLHESVESRPFETNKPQQWYPENPPVAQRDPASADERDHPLDPDFAQKIAEAERPKVPPPVVPTWARKAQDKQHRWESQVESAEQRYFGAAPATAPQESRPIPMPPPPAPSFSPRAAQDTFRPIQYKTVVQGGPYDDKWQHHYDQYHFETGQTKRSPLPRPRSVEPQGWRSRPQEKEPWFKPYVAPNVLNTKFSRSEHTSYSRQTQPGAGQNTQAHFGGMYYGPESFQKSPAPRPKSYTDYAEQPGGFERPKSPMIGSYERREVSVPTVQSDRPYWTTQGGDQSQRHFQSRYEKTTTHRTTEGPAPYTPTQVHRPPPIPQRSEWTSPSAPAAPPPSSVPLWRNESDAWRRKTEMEQEVQRRAASGGPAPQWRQGAAPSGLQGPDTLATQKWQDASGASTKSQTHGSYVDEHGNQVNYVKEVYTSSDPGSQFSMLTQEEKKALEEPLEPGVVSRHVTSKYYKRSTYTSQTTTSTTPSAPAVSYPKTTPSSSYRVGQVEPGVSQF